MKSAPRYRLTGYDSDGRRINREYVSYERLMAKAKTMPWVDIAHYGVYIIDPKKLKA